MISLRILQEMEERIQRFKVSCIYSLVTGDLVEHAILRGHATGCMEQIY